MPNYLDKMRRVSSPFRRSEAIFVKTMDSATKEKVTSWPKMKTIMQKLYGVGTGSRVTTRDNLKNAPNNSEGSVYSDSVQPRSEAASGASTAKDSIGTSSSGSTSTPSYSATPSYTSSPVSSTEAPSSSATASSTTSQSTGGSAVTSGATSGGSYSSGSSSAANSEYVCIDTRVFDRCIEQKDNFIRRYDEIVTFYDEIVKKLGDNWKGQGADAFLDDAKVVRTNIKGISDILSTMCNTLEDCREVVRDCDKSLEDLNRNPEKTE